MSKAFKARGLSTVALERTHTVNRSTLPERRPNPIDLKGGEPLAGSGFEAEEPENSFGSDIPEAEVA